MTIDEIVAAGRAQGMITKLHEALRTKRSRFAPVRLVEIPKPTGGTRPLGIATVEERIVPTAMTLVLEPIFTADLHDGSYGSRPKRDAKQAAVAMREDVYNRAWGVVEIDLQSYITSIPHEKLMKRIMQRIMQRIADGRRLTLIKPTRKVGVKDRGQGGATTVGVPQGSPISPLYSNIYLHLLEHLWHRYADDAIGVCRRSPQPVLAAFEASATRMEWTLNRDTTRVTRLPEGFDCLGLHFVKRKSPRSGKNTIAIFPAKSASQTMRNRLKYLTSRRAPSRPKACVEMGNPLMTGWLNYFRHTKASQAFRGLQRFVNIRFRRYVTQRSTGRGVGWPRFPNSKLYAMGLAYIGSGKLEYVPKPVHDGR